MATELALPSVPEKHSNFLYYIKSHPQEPVENLVKPYNEYDAVVRKLYAQAPSHPALADNYLNILPLYDAVGSADVPTRARDLKSESDELKAKYIMPLKDEDRRPNGSPAVVPTFKEFQTNFNLFSENSLSDLDWNNVVAAGSAVVTSLLPVPEEYRHSKRGLRKFFHEKFAPASDVDLFLYGLTEEQAIEKIKQIEAKVKDSILHETTTIRTKNTVTIASRYPTRHVQIVLRIYKSIAEILTGFDVDCSCAAYDGHQVYVAPRALASYVTQVNHVDLTRRSPSYENRLSKYSHRGFEVFWPWLDRSRVDPTIFERSFARTVGLARLLVLEKLPKSSDRDAYLQQRRLERGRPPANTYARRSKGLRGNIKQEWDDEVAEWAEEDEISDYHTFTIPYGPRFHARKIETLLYTKDLLLNAEWNKPKDREVNLHRHPAFFGNAEDVIHDCCGFCPVPVTPEAREVAEEENKIYVSGDITFVKDDPGRQAIGSFNPITETDWTEMAYVGNTALLCQAIVDHNLEEVKAWLSKENSDPNRRDYTGRTPLHLASMVSSPEIVQCLVDHGARLISRLADGRTALHLAAARGSVEIVRILLTKSEQNEEKEAKKGDLRKNDDRKEDRDDSEHGDALDDEDIDLVSDASDDSDIDGQSNSTGYFVKVNKEQGSVVDMVLDEVNELEPDIYDVNVVAWDTKSSPLHLAIIKGHEAVVEELVASFGADVLLPIKLLNLYNNTPRAAILTLVLALQLPIEEAKSMTAKLLQLGASPAQADLNKNTALIYIAGSKHTELIDILSQHDHPALERAINHLAIGGYLYDPILASALTTAIEARNVIGALKLLDAGAKPTIEFDAFVKSARTLDGFQYKTTEQTQKIHRQKTVQPIMLAINNEQPSVALELLARGADPNSLTPEGWVVQDRHSNSSSTRGRSLLDCVRQTMKRLREYKGEESVAGPSPSAPDPKAYLEGLADGTYKMWTAQHALKEAESKYRKAKDEYSKKLEEVKNRKGVEEKKNAIQALLRDFEKLESELLANQAKTFKELNPGIKTPPESQQKDKGGDYEWKAKHFKYSFDFRAPDLTEITREGYLKLFEAAWCGDFDTIKALTLETWGPDKAYPALQIATFDSHGLCPFSIAVLRGHLDMAKAILAIVQAQYKPKDDGKEERFTMRAAGNEDDDEQCSDDDDSPHLHIDSETINQQFTLENIGEAAAQVECDISPFRVLSWSCPAHLFVDQKEKDAIPGNLLQYAICQDNVDLLVLLLDLRRELSAKYSEYRANAISAVLDVEFQLAMRLGRLRCLTELIKGTGVGLPLDKLAQNSGVEVKETPIYYQGLSVHGKKRADWAAAGRGTHIQRPRDVRPPLLSAAYEGNLDSVEWFLGTAPSRHYVEFTKAHKHDKRLKRLAQSERGIEWSVMDWLNTQNNLVLHCAVLSKQTDESERLVRYLVENMPHCLEVKSVEGYTPLAVAFSMHRPKLAKILIEAGANQTVRDRKGNNLIHLLLCGIDNEPILETDNLQSLLDLLDPLLVPSLLTERSSEEPGALTPLARWMHKTNYVPYGRSGHYRYGRYAYNQEREPDDKLAVLRLLLNFAEHTGQKHLELLDGAGNSLLHDAVRWQVPKILGLMLDRRPDLLHRENATGCTPAELAENAWVTQVTSDPPKLPNRRYTEFDRHGDTGSIVRRSPESFLKTNREEDAGDDADDNGDRNAKKMIYSLCRERATSGTENKRRLVSLFEANEVARRLAAKKDLSSDESRDEQTDEFTVFYRRAKHVEGWARVRRGGRTFGGPTRF